MSTHDADSAFQRANSLRARNKLLAWVLKDFHQSHRKNPEEALANAWHAYRNLSALDQEITISTVSLYLSSVRARRNLLSERPNVALAVMLICAVSVQMVLSAMWSIPVYAMCLSYLVTRWLTYFRRANAYQALLAHLQGRLDNSSGFADDPTTTTANA